MSLTDVDWEQSRVLIRHGKGEKERCVGLGDVTAAALRDYVQRFRTAGEGALFLTSAGQRTASAGLPVGQAVSGHFRFGWVFGFL